MTILKVTVEDEQADLLRKLLQQVAYVKNIEEEHKPIKKEYTDPKPTLQRIQKILGEAKGKNLFKDIKDPSEWQPELRKEWDRDFANIS